MVWCDVWEVFVGVVDFFIYSVGGDMDVEGMCG